jgi:predicted small lipoprotein YifL
MMRLLLLLQLPLRGRLLAGVAVLVCVFSAGCGQKGALLLPHPDQARVPAASSEPAAATNDEAEHDDAR